jgi:hypothetical protein
LLKQQILLDSDCGGTIVGLKSSKAGGPGGPSNSL